MYSWLYHILGEDLSTVFWTFWTWNHQLRCSLETWSLRKVNIKWMKCQIPLFPIAQPSPRKYMQSTFKDLWITQRAYTKLIFFPHPCNYTAFIKINRILTVYFKATVSSRMCIALAGIHSTHLLSLPTAPPLHNIHLGISQGTDNSHLHPY